MPTNGPNLVKILALGAALSSVFSSVAHAQNPGAGNCSPGPNTTIWPDVNPVWEVCWVSPAISSGIGGSGLELTSVRYKGKPIFTQAHMPVLNVKYFPGGCGGPDLTYRDWMYELAAFEANNVDPDGTGNTDYAEPTTPPVTVCDHPGSDSGSFNGVAVEKRSDRLILTSQMSAGWYRYIQVWAFLADGRIEPRLKFTAVENPCTPKGHIHHAYWRFDFDLEGGSSNWIDQYSSGAWSNVASEAALLQDPPNGRKWRVRDGATNAGYEIIPGSGDGIADEFAVSDVWALSYSGSEKDDGGATSAPNGDAAHISNYVNGQSLQGTDVVLWYRAGVTHDTDEAFCETVGPTLRPFAPPAIQCPAPSEQECSSPSGAVVMPTIHVEDPDGDALTVQWEVDGVAVGTDNVPGGGPPTSADLTLTHQFSIGTHTVTATVSDGNTPPVHCTFEVTVEDTVPPEIAQVSATPSQLWPPNHKMVPVTVAVSATDLCSADTVCRIVSVSSNEAVDGLGDGHTAPDWEITGDLTLKLRAERSGRGSGRDYTVTVECTDAAGNSSTKSVIVAVPRDRRG